MRREELDRNPAYQLWIATNAWQRMVRRALAPIGLTHAQFVLLAATDLIGTEKGVVTQRQIARFADIDENMTSQVLRGMIERGYFTRTPHPDDARAWQIALTPAGVDLLTSARLALKPAKETFFAPIAGREEELADLLRDLTKGFECDATDALTRTS